jgi:hypothetical protein
MDTSPANQMCHFDSARAAADSRQCAFSFSRMGPHEVSAALNRALHWNSLATKHLLAKLGKRPRPAQASEFSANPGAVEAGANSRGFSG